MIDIEVERDGKSYQVELISTETTPDGGAIHTVKFPDGHTEETEDIRIIEPFDMIDFTNSLLGFWSDPFKTY